MFRLEKTVSKQAFPWPAPVTFKDYVCLSDQCRDKQEAAENSAVMGGPCGAFKLIAPSAARCIWSC